MAETSTEEPADLGEGATEAATNLGEDQPTEDAEEGVEDLSNEDPFPFDNLDDFEVVDEVEEPADEEVKTTEGDEEGGEETTAGVNDTDAGTEMTDGTEGAEEMEMTEATKGMEVTKATKVVELTEPTKVVDLTEANEVVDLTEDTEEMEMTEATEVVEDAEETTEAGTQEETQDGLNSSHESTEVLGAEPSHVEGDEEETEAVGETTEVMEEEGQDGEGEVEDVGNEEYQEEEYQEGEEMEGEEVEEHEVEGEEVEGEEMQGEEVEGEEVEGEEIEGEEVEGEEIEGEEIEVEEVEGEEVEGEEVEGEEQVEYEEEIDEDEEIVEEEVEGEEEFVEEEEEALEDEEEIEGEQDGEEVQNEFEEVSDEELINTEEVEMETAGQSLPPHPTVSRAARQQLRKIARNAEKLRKAVLIRHIKPGDLKDVLMERFLKDSVCFCVRFLGQVGCTKGGYLEARFNSREEARRNFAVIRDAIKKHGKTFKASMLDPGESPEDWLLNEWQKSISPAGIFESRCVFVNNVPECASERMLRALYPTAESIHLPLKPNGKTNGYAMLEFLSQEEAEEVVEHSERYKSRIGPHKLQLTILGQTKVPSDNDPTSVQPGLSETVKTGKVKPASNTSQKPAAKTADKKGDVKAATVTTRKPDAKKADSSNKLAADKADKKTSKTTTERSKTDPKKSSKEKKDGKYSGKERKSHDREKSDKSRKNSRDSSGKEKLKVPERESRRSTSKSQKSDRYSPERSTRGRRSTSDTRKPQQSDSRSSRSSDKRKDGASSEKTRSSSHTTVATSKRATVETSKRATVETSKRKDSKSQAVVKKTESSANKKVAAPVKAKTTNVKTPETKAKSGDQKKGGSGTVIPVQLGRTGNALKRPIETSNSSNNNWSDKRSRMDGPPGMPPMGGGPRPMGPGPYPMGMNAPPRGPMMRGNFPPQSPNMMRPGPPNMLNSNMGPMGPNPNFPGPQNMGQMGPPSLPGPQHGPPNTGPPMMNSPQPQTPMYMGPGQMNPPPQQQVQQMNPPPQQQGYGMDNRASGNWQGNRNPSNMNSNWEGPGPGRLESQEDIHNLRGELLKQLQVLETGSVSDPSDLSNIAQKLKQVQQTRNQPPLGGFSGQRPQQGAFPQGPTQGNYQQPQGNMGPPQGNYQNTQTPYQQQGNFQNMQQQQQQQPQQQYRNWPNQAGGTGPQGDPGSQYGYQSYSGNNNAQPNMSYSGNQPYSGMPGTGMDSYHTSKGSGMAGGTYNTDSRDVSVAEQKRRKTLCVQNLPKPLNYTEVKRFLRKEMVSQNMCDPQDLPVVFVQETKKGYSTVVFETELLAMRALQLDGISFQGHTLNIRKLLP